MHSPKSDIDLPSVVLVGTGVVGRAIAAAHVATHVSIGLCDQDADSLMQAVTQLNLDDSWEISQLSSLGQQLPWIRLTSSGDHAAAEPPMVIESIAERLDVKRAFFQQAETLFGPQAVLCSNTSTLRIGAIAEPLQRPERFCGLHFFMPVDQRPAVEVIRGAATSPATIDRCLQHADRIDKQPLVVADSPGFIVNRLLSPYLNEALLLLGRGVAATTIDRAARRYGMPMSPLELIDWIGTRTMFDAGRVYWQSFPSRVDPSPILPALVKRKRLGRAVDGGIYDYIDHQRSNDLADGTAQLVAKYQRGTVALSDDDVMLLLAVPMWIEAAIAFAEGTVTALPHFDLAMRGGLGYRPESSWLQFFDTLGSETLIDAITRFAPLTPAMRADPKLIAALQQTTPTEALRAMKRE